MPRGLKFASPRCQGVTGKLLQVHVDVAEPESGSESEPTKKNLEFVFEWMKRIVYLT